LNRPIEEVFERTCGVEKEDDLLAGEALDIEQVLAPGGAAGVLMVAVRSG
jgi:hypothetical protein